MKKINTIHYGGIWILLSILTGAVVPAIIWYKFNILIWWMCAVGVVGLLAFIVVFAIEMHQDFGKIPYYEKELIRTIQYDSNVQYPVIKASICTGEKVAGFKNKKDHSFTEVMLIRTPEDLERFKEIYNLENVKTEY